jgi:membrane dipeptidase
MGMTTRRKLLLSALGASGAALLPRFARAAQTTATAAAAPAKTYSARAVTLVRETTVIDMLSPFSLDFDTLAKWTANPEMFTAAMLQRYLDSGINVFHIAVGTGGPNAYDETLQFVAGWDSFIAGQDGALMRVDSIGDFDRVKAARKTGILVGVQNSEHFRKVDDVDLFHGLGQRVSQLTYNSRNQIGDGSTERTNAGLSDFGVAIVERMNKVGMAVDVSHSGEATSIDACSVSQKPVLFTHANARALNPKQPRCKSDEAIRAMARSGGVMGITGVRMFVKADEPTTIEHVLDHYDHVRDLVGVEHLGIGSDIDLDGYDDMPPELNKQLRASYKASYAFRDKIDIEGLDHPQRVYDLTEGLISRKYTDEQIRGILGGNFQRALGEIWTPQPAPVQAPKK